MAEEQQQKVGNASVTSTTSKFIFNLKKNRLFFCSKLESSYQNERMFAKKKLQTVKTIFFA